MVSLFSGGGDDSFQMEPKVSGFQSQMYADEDADLQDLQDREASINRLEVRDFNTVYNS